MTGPSNDLVTVTQAFVTAQLPLFIADLNAMPEPLRLAREALDELRISHPESTPSNVVATYMSPWKSHLLNPKFTPLCNAVVQLARVSAAGIGGDLAKLNVELAVSDCWGAIYETSDLTRRHNHFPAEFAAAVYLEAAEDCAPIVFSGNTPVQPRPGMLLLFPGILDHEVPATSGRRVVVAMNLYKKATFGVV